MISVPLSQDGPDLDQVRQLLAEDPSIKGMWIVPMYSNPNGAIYTEEVTSGAARDAGSCAISACSGTTRTRCIT